MGKVVKKVAKFAPLALGFIPGLQPLAAAALGAGFGALSGGGLKGALLGGVTGGLGAGGATALGKAAGLTGTGLKTASGALQGAAAGAYTGDGKLKNALIGAGLGGLGGFGSSTFGDPYAAIEAGDMAGAGFLDKAAGSLAGSGLGQGISKGVSALGGLTSGGVEGAGQGGGSSSFLDKASTAGSLLNTGMAQENAEDDLLAAQGRSEAALDPYMQAGRQGNARLSELLGLSGDPNAEGYGSLGQKFTPPDLANDPGYQFRLQQGEQGLNRALGAKGKVFSGEALKAASELNQGYASQAYNDAFNQNRAANMDIYNRYAGLAGSGQNAANSLTGVYDNQGNIRANAGMAQSNLINSGLSQFLGGAGNRVVVGYKPDGTPIYEDDGIMEGA